MAEMIQEAETGSNPSLNAMASQVALMSRSFLSQNGFTYESLFDGVAQTGSGTGSQASSDVESQTDSGTGSSASGTSSCNTLIPEGNGTFSSIDGADVVDTSSKTVSETTAVGSDAGPIKYLLVRDIGGGSHGGWCGSSCQLVKA